MVSAKQHTNHRRAGTATADCSIGNNRLAGSHFKVQRLLRFANPLRPSYTHTDKAPATLKGKPDLRKRATLTLRSATIRSNRRSLPWADGWWCSALKNRTLVPDADQLAAALVLGAPAPTRAMCPMNGGCCCCNAPPMQATGFGTFAPTLATYRRDRIAISRTEV